MRSNRPIAAAVLTFIGGLFLLLGAGFQILFLGVLSLFNVLHTSGVWPLWIGLVFSGLVLLVAILLWAVPTPRVAWGILGILLAFVSLPFTALGGFLIGFLLTLFGGVLAIFSRRRRAMTVFAVGPGPFPPPPS